MHTIVGCNVETICSTLTNVMLFVSLAMLLVFVCNSQDLEETVELLSSMLEKPAKTIFTERRRILTIAENARRRVQVMLDGFENGFGGLEGVHERK